MEWLSQLTDIDRRAASIGLTAHELCRRAGVGYTTYWRWMNGGMPTVRSLSWALPALEQVLAQEERRLRKVLAQKEGRLRKVLAQKEGRLRKVPSRRISA